MTPASHNVALPVKTQTSLWRPRLFSCLVVFLSTSLLLAQAEKPKLSIHGYLTQAYAQSDQYQFLGIPEDGTSDYRNLALQFRFDFQNEQAAVVQFSHKRVGLSPVLAFTDDLELDWGFYEYKFNGTTAIKIGKVQLPLGLYNEVRDVGTVLPFYRISSNIYGEGTWTSETVDGFVFSTGKNTDADWNLELDIFFGGWNALEYSDPDELFKTRIEDGVGFQLRVETPVENLRLGLHWHHETIMGGLRPPDTKENQTVWSAFLEGEFGRCIYDLEIIKFDQVNNSYWRAYDIHFGYRITDHWQCHLQRDHADFKYVIPSFATADVDYDDDAISLNYLFTRNLVLKLEYHWTKSYDAEGDAPTDIFSDPPVEVNFGIISLSATF